MELKQYFTPLLRYWWLLVAASLVAAVSTYVIASRQPLIYQTRTTLIIGRAVYQSNPTSTDLWVNQMLANYYADLAQRQPVRDATREALGINGLPSYIVRPLPNSQLLEISVSDTNPLRAQAVANELANQLILQSPTSPQNQGQERQAFVDQQLTDLEVRINDARENITHLEAEVLEANSARQVADLMQEINTQNSLLNTLQGNYADLLQSSDRGAINTLSVIEPAALPNSPVGPARGMLVLLSSLVAMAIAAGAAYLLEYLDDTIKTPEDVARAMKVPTLGVLGRIDGEDVPDKLVAVKRPLSPIVETYRVLRMNLQFSSLDKPLKTLMITSPHPKEGKSIILANLAVVIAQSGLRVIVIDADMRRPSVHNIFGLQNRIGLSNAVLVSYPEVMDYLQETKVKNLRVLTSGPLPPNPGDLLGSERFGDLVEALKKEADVILFDSPPCLLVADSPILGTRVDGVILVNHAGKTRRKDAQRAVEELRRVRVNLLGVVVNRQSGSLKDYYQSQYYSYHVDEEGDQIDSPRRRKSGKRFFPFLQSGRPGDEVHPKESP